MSFLDSGSQFLIKVNITLEQFYPALKIIH